MSRMLLAHYVLLREKRGRWVRTVKARNWRVSSFALYAGFWLLWYLNTSAAFTERLMSAAWMSERRLQRLFQHHRKP